MGLSGMPQVLLGAGGVGGVGEATIHLPLSQWHRKAPIPLTQIPFYLWEAHQPCSGQRWAEALYFNPHPTAQDIFPFPASK